MKHIFISFSPKDRRHMMTLRENLLRIGYTPWIDPNPRPGQDWRFDIDDAIRSADAVMVIVTPASAESIYTTYEWSLALGLGIPVIPVVFAKVKQHPRLNVLEHFDVTSFRDERHFWDYFTRELQRIMQIAPEPGIKPPTLAAVPPPGPDALAAANPPAASFTRQVMPQDPGFYLVVRRGPGLNMMYQLDKNIVTLGRDGANDIHIDDPEVSRYHLRLHWAGSGYSVEDLGSTNGTRINGGQRVSGQVELSPGNALMLGDTIILSYEVV
jgi:hypothetical protein